MQHVFAGEGAPPLSGPPVEQHIVPPPLEPPGADLVVVRDALRKDLSSEIRGRSCRARTGCARTGRVDSGVGQLHDRQRGSSAGRAAADRPRRRSAPGHPECHPRRGPHRRRADPDVQVFVELGPVDCAGDAGRRLSDSRRSRSIRRGCRPPAIREFHPLVPNDSPANRAKNRRTDIVILNTATRKAEEPARR